MNGGNLLVFFSAISLFRKKNNDISTQSHVYYVSTIFKMYQIKMDLCCPCEVYKRKYILLYFDYDFYL